MTAVMLLSSRDTQGELSINEICLNDKLGASSPLRRSISVMIEMIASGMMMEMKLIVIENCYRFDHNDNDCHREVILEEMFCSEGCDRLVYVSNVSHHHPRCYNLKCQISLLANLSCKLESGEGQEVNEKFALS